MIDPLTTGTALIVWYVWVVVPNPTDVYCTLTEISGNLKLCNPEPTDSNLTGSLWSYLVRSVPATPIFANLKELSSTFNTL